MSGVWESYPLQSLVIKVGSGSTPKGGSEAYKKAGVPLIRSMNVVFFGFKRAGLAYIDANQAAQLDNATVKAGDVLLNITGASIGRVTLAPDEFEGARVNQHVCIIRPNEALDARFLNAYLSSPALQRQIWNDNFGVTRQALTKQQILDFKVPVPPRSEQIRIVNQLHTLLTRIQCCNNRFDAIPALLKRFRQAVLDAATSGRLTEEWRELAGSTLDSWNTVPVGDLITGIQAGLNVTCEERPPLSTEKGLVKISAVTWGRFDEDESKTLPADSAVSERVRIQSGDFLISRANTLELVGACVIVEEISRNLYLSDKVLRLLVAEELKPWLLFCLRSRAGRQQIESLASGNQLSMRNLSQANLKSILIPVPTVKEQAEIIRRVKAMFALADRIEARASAARFQTRRLAPLTLAKAFRGELVPQDPDDESASDLLNRIAVAQSQKPKTRIAKKGVQQTRKVKLQDVNPVDTGDEPLDEPMKLDSVPSKYLENLVPVVVGVNAKELWRKSKLSIDDFYVQLSKEIDRGLLEIDPHDESRIHRSSASQRGQA